MSEERSSTLEWRRQEGSERLPPDYHYTPVSGLSQWVVRRDSAGSIFLALSLKSRNPPEIRLLDDLRRICLVDARL